MADLASTVSANREAIDVYIDVARVLDSDRWVAPAKADSWSPVQITEHLIRTFDFGSGVLEGRQVLKPLPGFLRWLIGKTWLRPTLRNGRFTGKTRAPKVFQPRDQPQRAAELLGRLRASSERFSALIEQELGRGRQAIDHPMFGKVGLLDFLALQVIHVRHHRAQLPSITP